MMIVVIGNALLIYNNYNNNNIYNNCNNCDDYSN